MPSNKSCKLHFIENQGVDSKQFNFLVYVSSVRCFETEMVLTHKARLIYSRKTVFNVKSDTQTPLFSLS